MAETTFHSRSEKSLSTLTVKFVEMIKDGKGPLDLNHVNILKFVIWQKSCYLIASRFQSIFKATKTLEVAKKRRIYDITNVLEGVNLIEKIEKNLYVWRGRSSDDEQDNRLLEDLVFEKNALEEMEAQLDK